jgi:hypothetical protein
MCRSPPDGMCVCGSIFVCVRVCAYMCVRMHTCGRVNTYLACKCVCVCVCVCAIASVGTADEGVQDHQTVLLHVFM